MDGSASFLLPKESGLLLIFGKVLYPQFISVLLENGVLFMLWQTSLSLCVAKWIH